MPANSNPIIFRPHSSDPIQKNDQGGYDILLRKQPLSQPAITDQPAPASDMPPAMADEQGGFVGNMPRPRPEDGPAAPAGGVGDVIDSVFGSGGESTTGTHDAAPPDMGGGPLSKLLPGGWGDTIASAVGGMQDIDRNQSPIAAFASGMGGAMTTRENRRKSKREEMLSDEDRQIAAEERAYRHGRDTIGDEREAHRMDLADRADARAGRTADMNEVESGLNLDTARLNLDKARKAELADQFGMSPAEQAVADKAVADEIAVIVGKDNDSFTIGPEDDTPDKIRAKTDNYLNLKHQLQQQEYAKYAVETPTTNPAGTAKPSEADASKPGVSAASALSWAPGQAPATDGEMTAQLEAAVEANNGNPIYVKNPRTGEVRLYVSKRAR